MKYTNKHNLPTTLVEAIVNDPYDVDLTDHQLISVTRLISPPKMRMLQLRHHDELEEDISENIWRLLGQAVHAILERVPDAERFIEERLCYQVGGKTITGKTDIYEHGLIQDYKITSAWTILFNPDGKQEWEQQLNCLAFLFRTAGFSVTWLRIVAILRDWKKREAQKNSSYPQIPVVWVEVPLWTFEAQKDFILERLSLHALSEDMASDDIPPCTPQERWATKEQVAVYKNENKTATRVLDTHTQAEAFIAGQDQKHSWRIVTRPGEDRRCMEYCSVVKHCSYGRKYCE